MTLLELKQLLSTLLADSSSNFYTDGERLQAINNGCAYINSELRILRTVANITITPLNSGRVPLPADFVSMGQGVTWDGIGGQSVTLNRLNVLQLQDKNAAWANDTGIPQSYVIEGGNIYLYPVPNSSGTLNLSYVAMPNKLVDNTDVPFYDDVRTQAYHDCIAFYAAWLLTLKDRDFEAAQQFMGYFQARLVDLKENLRHTGDVSVQPVWTDTYSSA